MPVAPHIRTKVWMTAPVLAALRPQAEERRWSLVAGQGWRMFPVTGSAAQCELLVTGGKDSPQPRRPRISGSASQRAVDEISSCKRHKGLAAMKAAAILVSLYIKRSRSILALTNAEMNPQANCRHFLLLALAV